MPRAFRLGLLLAAACAPATTSCVKFKSGCVGMSIAPAHYAARVGQSQVFTTQVQGTPTQSCTFTVSSSAAADLVDVGQPNQKKLVVKSTLGSFLLRAVSVDDPSRHCNVLVSVFNYNFSTHTPLALQGLATDQLLGDVAFGGSGSSTLLPSLAPVDPKVYLATFRLDNGGILQEDTVRRFSLSALNAGNATPEYDMNPTIGVPGFFDPGFSTQNTPRLAADGSGNAYWIHDTGGVSRIDRLRATLAQGQVPNAGDSSDFTMLGIFMVGGTDLAADVDGNLYVIGVYVPPPIAPAAPTAPRASSAAVVGNPSLLRVRDAYGTPIVEVVLADAFNGSSWFLAVDGEGRILMAVDGAVGPQLVRVLPTGGMPGVELGSLDPTFVLDGTLLGRVTDLDVDAAGVVYLAESLAGTAIIHLVNDQGHIVDQIPHDPANPVPDLHDILGVGVSADGSIGILDRLSVAGQPPGQFFLVVPGPLN